ncbi:MAG: BamA/TamA family outer membrane protein [Sphingomonadales bacterium]
MRRSSKVQLFVFATLFLAGCRLSKNVPHGNYLLRSTSITLDNPLSTKLDRYVLSQVLRQQPNARFFGAPWKLWLYNSIDSSKVAQKKIERYQSFEQKLARKRSKVSAVNVKRNARAIAKGKQDFRYKTAPDSTFKQAIWAEKLKYKYGQKPVVFDTLLHHKNEDQLGRYLVKKGYYYGKVSSEIICNEKKRSVQAIYHINEGSVYIIDSVAYSGPRLLRDLHQKFIRKEFEPTGEHPLIGKPFDLDYLSDYRERVAKFMRDESVYKFNSGSIQFAADTNRQTMTVYLMVKFEDRMVPSAVNPDSLIRVPYRETKINRVYFHLADTLQVEGTFANEIAQKGLSIYDSLQPQYLQTLQQLQHQELAYSKKQAADLKVPYGTKSNWRSMTLRFNGAHPWIHPDILEMQNYLEQGNTYKEYYLDRSYRSLVQLGVFTSVKPYIEEIPGSNQLNVHYYLEPAKKQSWAFDPRFTSSFGLLGAAASLNYTNKNLFGGAERLTFSLGGGFESQPPVFDASASEQLIVAGRTFNTFELGPSLKLDLPGLFPTPVTLLGKRQKPRTVISAALNFEKRNIFDRRVFQLNYTWKFLVGKTQVFQMGLPGASVIKYVNIEKSASFEAQLNQINDLFLYNTYSNQFIWQDFKFAYEYSNKDKDQKPGQKKRYSGTLYFNSSLDAAGNLLYAFRARQDTLNGQYLLGKQPYSQFLRLDNQFIASKRLLNKTTLHLRMHAGAGLSYGNSQTSMPYDYSFFGGGSNDNRGWRARALGPGAYKYHLDTNRLATQIGDIRFGGSLEYRFELNSTFKGALFTDFGNIWTYREDASRAGSQFNVQTFIPQIAISSGIGLRMDLEFFILRLDVGFPVFDPAFADGARWVFQDFKDRETYYQEGMQYFNMSLEQVKAIMPRPFLPNYLNFGIGYPF